MKIHLFAFVVLLVGKCDAFLPQAPSRSSGRAPAPPAPLQAQTKDWLGPLATAAAGWTVAAQLAFAAPVTDSSPLASGEFEIVH